MSTRLRPDQIDDHSKPTGAMLCIPYAEGWLSPGDREFQKKINGLMSEAWASGLGARDPTRWARRAERNGCFREFSVQEVHASFFGGFQAHSKD